MSKALLVRRARLDPLSFMMKCNEDVPGAYKYTLSLSDDFTNRPNRAHIEIYCAVIGWVAETMKYALDDLALVVITHELAHAYTQLGGDIDGYRWNVVAFAEAEAEVELVEGIAQ